MQSLPVNGAGSSIFHGNTPGTTGILTTQDEFYAWLEGVLGVLYKDAECGNGVCEAPEEVPGVGRFGWSVRIRVVSNPSRLESESVRIRVGPNPSRLTLRVECRTCHARTSG